MSEPVHHIRLREPWKTETRDGEVLLYRRFGKPTRLEPGQTVWLVFPETSGFHRVTFNGQELLANKRRWEVTEWLAERNEIGVRMPEGADQTPISQGVVLEIMG